MNVSRIAINKQSKTVDSIGMLLYSSFRCDWIQIYYYTKYKMFTLLLSSIILTFLALFYVYITRNRNYWKKRSVVGPEPTILYGTYPKSSKNEPGYNFLVEADEIFL